MLEYYTDKNGVASYKKGKKSLEDGETYLMIPGYSSENKQLHYKSAITGNATMDISAAKDGLNMTIQLEKVVRNNGYEQRISKMKYLPEHLPDYAYDETGECM